MAGARYIADPVETAALDGLSVLFHEASGMTHIVAPPAPQILEALGEGPADAPELLRRLRRRFEFQDEDGIHARLAELESAGLVRRA